MRLEKTPKKKRLLGTPEKYSLFIWGGMALIIGLVIFFSNTVQAWLRLNSIVAYLRAPFIISILLIVLGLILVIVAMKKTVEKKVVPSNTLDRLRK